MTYVVDDRDANRTLACRVTGTNAGGSASVTTLTLHVGAPSAPPPTTVVTPSLAPAPTPVVSLGATVRAGAPLVLDASRSASGSGDPIASYGVSFETPAGRFQATCPASAPYVSATFSAPASVTATVTAISTSGAMGSVTVPFAVAAPLHVPLRRARVLTPLSRSAVTSTRCASSNTSAAFARNVGARHPTSQTLFAGCPKVFQTTIQAGLVDIDQSQACNVGTDDPTLVPAPEWALLKSKLIAGSPLASVRSASAHAASGGQGPVDTFYIFKGPVSVDGLDIEPASGASVVLAVGGSTTNFEHDNAAYLVSGHAKIYVKAPGTSLKLPINWNIPDFTGTKQKLTSVNDVLPINGGTTSNPLQAIKDPNGFVGGPIDLDVSAVQYVTGPGGNVVMRPHTSAQVANFDIGHVTGQPLSFPDLPFDFSGTLGASFDLNDQGLPETTLAHVAVSIPGITGPDSKLLTGAADIRADNPHGGAYLDCVGIAVNPKEDATLAKLIPITHIDLTYYDGKGFDRPACIPPGRGDVQPTHPAKSIVGSVAVALSNATLSGRLVLPSDTSQLSLSLGYDNPAGIQIDPFVEVPIYLTHAGLQFNAATGGKLSGDVKLAAVFQGVDPSGDGIIGIDGHAYVTFRPFHVHADEQGTFLGLKMGQHSSYDLSINDPSGVTVAVGKGNAFDLGVLNVGFNSNETATLNVGGDASSVLGEFDASGDGSIDLPVIGQLKAKLELLASVSLAHPENAGVVGCATVQWSDAAKQAFDKLANAGQQLVNGAENLVSTAWNDTFGKLRTANGAPAVIRDNGPTTMQVGAGFHWLNIADEVASSFGLGAAAAAGTAAGLPELLPGVLLPRMLVGNDIRVNSCNVGAYTVIPVAGGGGGGGGVPDWSFGITSGPGFFGIPTFREARAAATGTPHQEVIVVHGQGGVPDPILTTPSRTTTVNGGVPTGIYGPVGVFHDATTDTTEFDIVNPVPGDWSVAAAPGSVPIASVDTAVMLPPPVATGTVRLRRGKVTVSYTTHNLVKGTKLAFLERTAGGATAPLGVTSTTPSGTVSYPAVAASSRQARTVLVQPTPPGRSALPPLPLGGYRYAPPQLGRPSRIRAKIAKTGITVRFTPAANATGSIVVVRLVSGQAITATIAGRRRIAKITGTGGLPYALVSVRGTLGSRRGQVARLRG